MSWLFPQIKLIEVCVLYYMDFFWLDLKLNVFLPESDSETRELFAPFFNAMHGCISGTLYHCSCIHGSSETVMPIGCCLALEKLLQFSVATWRQLQYAHHSGIWTLYNLERPWGWMAYINVEYYYCILYLTGTYWIGRGALPGLSLWKLMTVCSNDC